MALASIPNFDQTEPAEHIRPRQQRAARRNANRRIGDAAREKQPFLREPVEVRGYYIRIPITPQITPAMLIRKNKENLFLHDEQETPFRFRYNSWKSCEKK
jgi:hypothetical protein